MGLQPSKLAECLGIPTRLVKLAESEGVEQSFTVERTRRVKDYLESRGIEFLPDESEPSVRLRSEPS